MKGLSEVYAIASWKLNIIVIALMYGNIRQEHEMNPFKHEKGKFCHEEFPKQQKMKTACRCQRFGEISRKHVLNVSL